MEKKAEHKPQMVPTAEHSKPTFGPVKDLEAHVPSEWWRQLFNGLYLKTDGDVVMDKELTESEIDLFVEVARLQPGDRILDLCCGQGRHTLELARRGFKEVEGLDRSHTLIQRARRSARSEALPIRFREGDARKLPYGDNHLDAVLLLGNSFGYFETVEDDLRILCEVARTLGPDGRILIDVTDGDFMRDSFEPRAWEWVDSKTFVCRERSLSQDRQRLISREIITHAERGVLADQFYAERLYSRGDLLSLLAEAGFVNPIIHTEMTTASRRNQDLGMMARRLIIGARVAKAAPTQASDGGTTNRRVAVIMGDPSISDSVKPDATFDQDDYDTIQRLQTALADVPASEFIYFNRHETLLEDLLHRRDEIDLVFNLCDEGFRNRARWELHVPALLQALNIPFTGSGPQSLAYCFDKSLVRGIAQEMGLPVADAVLLGPGDSTVELPSGFPVLLKPNSGDSSVGITKDSVVDNPEDLFSLLSSLREQFGHDALILAESFLPGRDLSVGIIGNLPDDYVVLPIVEEDYSQLPGNLPQICGYEAKWDPESPYWNLRSRPADLPADTLNHLRESCLRLFTRLECRDYARFDWRLDADGEPRLLEVNPNPGWCWDGHLAKMAALAGLSYAQMLAAMLGAADRRLKREREPTGIDKTTTLMTAGMST
jgi:D-alanine-D-alanine ligase